MGKPDCAISSGGHKSQHIYRGRVVPSSIVSSALAAVDAQNRQDHRRKRPKVEQGRVIPNVTLSFCIEECRLTENPKSLCWTVSERL